MNSAPVEVFFEFFSPSEAMCVSIPSATQMIIIVVSIIISTIRIVIRNELLFIDRRNSHALCVVCRLYCFVFAKQLKPDVNTV